MFLFGKNKKSPYVMIKPRNIAKKGFKVKGFINLKDECLITYYIKLILATTHLHLWCNPCYVGHCRRSVIPFFKFRILAQRYPISHNKFLSGTDYNLIWTGIWYINQIYNMIWLVIIYTVVWEARHGFNTAEISLRIKTITDDQKPILTRNIRHYISTRNIQVKVIFDVCTFTSL